MGMLRGFSAFLFSLFIASQCFHSGHSQECTLDGTLQEAFPNIFNITELSYTLTVEANLKLQKETFYVTESYDKEFARGKVDLLFGGKTTSVLYFNETKEVFITKDMTCTTYNMDEAYELPFEQFNAYEWRGDDLEQPILGPSNLLKFGYKQSLKNVVRKEIDTQSVRGVKTNVWKLCDNDNKVTVRFFFADSKTENGFGIRGKPVPLRITVQGVTGEEGYQIDHSYDVVNYQIFVPDYANAFKIPKMMGCKRLAKDTKSPPSLAGKDFYMEAEVVYTPWGSSNYSYVTNIALAKDEWSQHFEYEMTTWKSHKDAEIAEPGEDLKIIWDIRNEYEYTIVESFKACLVDNEGVSPRLKFPDGQILDLTSVHFMLSNETVRKSYHYLGEDTERGIPVSVFESKVQEDTDFDFDDIMITRYYLSDDTLLNTDFTEKHAPMKIVYSNFNIMGKFTGIVVFNIYSFTTHLQNKKKLFDVTSCFENNDQSKWVQLTFPMRDVSSGDVVPHIPYIEDNFLNLLAGTSESLRVSPLRIPKIMVDVDADNIYVTFLILERPDFMLDFASQGKYGLLDDRLTQGITTQTQCAKACLERDTCMFFSYCGAICTLADEDLGEDGQKQNDQCEMFIHDKFDTALPTMDDFSDLIASSVEMGEISFSLPGPKNKVMTFLAVGYKDGLAFGVNGIYSRREDDIDNRFRVSVIGHKFDETVADVVKPMGVQSMSSCRRMCTSNPECESLSFCQATSECSLSTLHKEQMESSHIKENWQCQIMSRVYEDYFEHYPGFVLNQIEKKTLVTNTSEECARACVQEKSFKCLSFDFCFATRACALHTTHFLDINKNDDKSVSLGEICGHYSKKLIYDFDADLGNQIVGEEMNAVVIKDLPIENCAKYCLEDSKISCQTFDFCLTGEVEKPVRTCRLFSKAKSELSKTSSARCRIYQKSARRAPKSAPAAEGYKQSTVGGVGFFVFLIGLAIGVGGMFGYGYYRANRK